MANRLKTVATRDRKSILADELTQVTEQMRDMDVRAKELRTELNGLMKVGDIIVGCNGIVKKFEGNTTFVAIGSVGKARKSLLDEQTKQTLIAESLGQYDQGASYVKVELGNTKPAASPKVREK